MALTFVREINFLQIFIFTDNNQKKRKNNINPNNYSIYLIKVYKFNTYILHQVYGSASRLIRCYVCESLFLFVQELFFL